MDKDQFALICHSLNKNKRNLLLLLISLIQKHLAGKWLVGQPTPHGQRV